jgi:chromosome segregation ATPase
MASKSRSKKKAAEPSAPTTAAPTAGKGRKGKGATAIVDAVVATLEVLPEAVEAVAASPELEEVAAEANLAPEPPSLDEAALKLGALEADLVELRARCGEAEEALASERTELQLLRTEKEELEEQVRQLRLGTEEFRQSALLHEQQLEELRQASQALEQQTRAELTETVGRLASAEEQASQFEFELELTQQRLVEATALAESLPQVRQEVERLQDELAQALAKLDSRDLRLDEQAEQIEQLRSEIEELDLLREDLEETIVARRRELRELRVSEAEARELAEQAEARKLSAEADQARLRSAQEQELARLEEILERSRARAEELEKQLEQVSTVANQEAIAEAERRHLAAERRLVELMAEVDSLRSGGSDRERLERRVLLLENDLKAANQEVLNLERAQSRLETERNQLQEEVQRFKNQPAAADGGADEGELRQWKLRCEDLRESLRKQRAENERLTERVDVLIKAKELEERQRKEVESRLRTALRIQSRQQGY